jgi:Ca2+-binding RTX toxin-like protein
VIEASGAGDDLVSSSVSFTLSDNVERLTLSGTAAVDGVGNALSNTLTGNSGANRLDGLEGADTLNGGKGDDTLDGGAGADRLSGSIGVDRFVFQSGQATGDAVVDFAAGDRLEFRGYGAGSTLTKVAGSTTNWTITDGQTGATEVITLVNKYALTAGDYLFS